MKRNNQINIPQAKEAIDKLRIQAANEVGVNLTNGYSGHLTSRETGSVGGQMARKITTTRTMTFLREDRILAGHPRLAGHIAGIGI